jgi:DNA-binding MarR family transcriptional regulator
LSICGLSLIPKPYLAESIVPAVNYFARVKTPIEGLLGVLAGIILNSRGSDVFLTGERPLFSRAWATTYGTPRKSVAERSCQMNNPYLEVISLVERLHRQFMEVMKLELEGSGVHDINNVQAMMLFNIGDVEMTVGELTLRGCYLGSNVSYNVKKMVQNKYLVHERSAHDRRSIRVRLTERGMKLRDSLTVMHQRHAELLSRSAPSADDLQVTSVTLRRLERFWIRAADLVQPREPVPLYSSALLSGATPP